MRKRTNKNSNNQITATSFAQSEGFWTNLPFLGPLDWTVWKSTCIGSSTNVWSSDSEPYVLFWNIFAVEKSIETFCTNTLKTVEQFSKNLSSNTFKKVNHCTLKIRSQKHWNWKGLLEENSLQKVSALKSKALSVSVGIKARSFEKGSTMGDQRNLGSSDCHQKLTEKIYSEHWVTQERETKFICHQFSCKPTRIRWVVELLFDKKDYVCPTILRQCFLDFFQ